MRNYLFLTIVIASIAGAASGAPPAGGQPVQLPIVLNDDFGSTWDVQWDGSIGDGGNDLYDGGGRLFVNNANQYMAPNQQATIDASRNEVILPPVMMGQVRVSRRVQAMKALGAVRFVEILENPSGTPIRVQLRAYFNMGGSVQQAIPLVDEKRGKGPVGYAIGDQSNAVAMIGAGRGSKVLPRFQYQFNNDNVDLFYDVDVPARQTAVIVHCQLRRKTAGASAEAWSALRERDLLNDLPKDIRRRVVNFPGGDSFIGDREVLRGEGLDVVELRGGDAYRGRLKLDAIKIQTVYGPITLAAENVVCILNVGVFGPSQLVVTSDGDVFGGRLIDLPTIPLQLSSGQITRIPMPQITRIGFHRRPGEPDEWDFENKSVAYLRTGERMRLKPLPNDLELATPSGPVRLNPSVISSITFTGEDVSVPEVRLVDGSKLSGLLPAAAFELPLAAAAGQVSAGTSPSLAQSMMGTQVRIPAPAMLKLQLAPERDGDDLAPTLTMTNQDTLIGQLTGSLSLETRFDTITVEGVQIKGLRHAGAGGPGGGLDVQITLWDDSTLSGRLAQSHLTCQLRCGMSMRVPVALVEEYAQPLPEPSPKVSDQIRTIANQLDSDDYSIRERAQSDILAIGPSALSILKVLRKSAPPEARGRIEVLTQRLVREIERPGQNTGPAQMDAEGDFNPGNRLRFQQRGRLILN